MIDVTEVKINRPKKQLANYSGKKKCHDMKLFKMSRRNIGQAGKILADSGY
ncbi:transposase [Streptococcus pneumoniae]|nr:transposase [Streptococcus pneumoniae]